MAKPAHMDYEASYRNWIWVTEFASNLYVTKFWIQYTRNKINTCINTADYWLYLPTTIIGTSTENRKQSL